MCPVEYIKRTRELFAKQGFPPYRWTENPDCPHWAPLRKPIDKCRVALLSTGGIYIKDKQPPFNPDRDDLTFREIPKDVDSRTLAISHNNYDHTDAEKDINCVFPIETLCRLEKQNYIGEFASIAYTVMGRIFRRTALQQELAPQILQKLKDAEVDVFLLVPA
jgi:D-proline reductase (dithiol) PrdB